MTLFDTGELKPGPYLLTAMTMNEYTTPLVSPRTVHWVVRHGVTFLPGNDSIRYESTFAAPLDAGARKVTVAD